MLKGVLFSFFPAAVSQGPLGPDGPLGETGPEGLKVSMQANLLKYKAPLHTCFYGLCMKYSTSSVLAAVFGARGSFLSENIFFVTIKLTPFLCICRVKEVNLDKKESQDSL